MIATPALITVIKYGFLGLVITGAGFLIANTVLMVKYKSEKLEDKLTYKAHSSAMNGSSILDKNSLRCLTHPSRPFCLMSSRKRLQILNSKHLSLPKEKLQFKETINIEFDPSPIFTFMQHFKNLMKTLEVKLMLLEPSVLFCMLPPLQKYSLISNGFDTNILQGSPNVVTFGIFEKEAFYLSQESLLQKVLQTGYELSRAQKWFELSSSEDDAGQFYPTNFFFSKDNMTAHVIVFYQRQHFLWYPGQSKFNLLVQKGSFRKNSIFENFTSIPFNLENEVETGFYLPSQTNRFLYQIQSSEYEICSTMLPSNENYVNRIQHILTYEELNQRAHIAIQELKQQLSTKMAKFWLWQSTLDSWQKRCELFYNTPDFNVAVPALAVSDMNFTQAFNKSDYLTLFENYVWENILHKVVLDCFGLRINIYPTYEDSTSIWYFEGNSTDYLTKITYEKFTLCATDVLGQLMHKPCGKKLKREINNL